MLSYGEALAAMLAGAAPLGTEMVALEQAAGRALAGPLVSPLALPPWDNSGMDGYAVQRADLTDASPAHPALLPVVGTIAAGADPARLGVLSHGTAMRIMTGAPVPPGADTVIRVEDTDTQTRDGVEYVAIRDARDATGRGNIRPHGEDVAEGAQVFRAGERIRAAHIGVMASLGYAQISVMRRPRVVVMCGGDELVLLDQFAEVQAGRRIVSSSSYALPVLLRDAGADVTVLPLVPDTLADTMQAIEQALALGCDLLVTTGGVSVGAYDYTRDALAALGGVVDFWRAKIRPGGPVGTGTVRGTRWLGLPGNPVSTMVTATVFAWPLLQRLGGYAEQPLRSVRVIMHDVVETPAPLTYFVRVRLTPRDDGQYDAHTAGPQGSNLLHTMAVADALLMVPENCRATLPGTMFDAVLLP
ncbi:MAG: molybdopterin molybdotransferase MoeA [Gemmatimonadaceae bacterium]|nr:molybdopterin molybdotransferase MoeA [Gemmatimonadaceae bacterium]